MPEGERFAWEPASTYVRLPPYFEDMPREPAPLREIEGARVLALLGDSVTTDHISPAGSIKRDSPAGLYLQEQGVGPRDFNSYGARRGNHEVMVRGTFANIRLRNLLAADRGALPEGGYTYHLSEQGAEQMTIYEAAMRYAAEGVELVVLAGREYGTGSSRDWAAKGTKLLGVRAVIADSFERIHRSNLIGMGVLPLQFPAGRVGRVARADAARSASGSRGWRPPSPPGEPMPSQLRVRAVAPGGEEVGFDARVRIDTPREAEYFRHGGILQFVLRSLLAG